MEESLPDTLSIINPGKPRGFNHCNLKRMDYSQYTVEDFIEDPVFIEWVLMPGPELNLFWENWLLDHPEKLEEIRRSKKLLLAFQYYKEYPRDENRKRKSWAAIERINEEDKNKAGKKITVFPMYPQHRSKATNRAPYKITTRLAVVFMGILLLSIIAVNHVGDPPGRRKEAIFITEISPKGQKSKIVLPDGSIVCMNGDSRLSYSSRFSTDKREVILSGEAFFEVVKDPSRPFVVVADKLITTALGTSFNIKAYPEDKEVLVSLLTGRVFVQRQNSAGPVLFLNSREAAGLNQEGVLMQKEFNYEQDILWKDGILYFNERRLEEAFKRLEKCHGVTFILQNLPRRPIIVTGKFDNETLDNILRSLSYTSNFTYAMENEVVIISFK